MKKNNPRYNIKNILLHSESIPSYIGIVIIALVSFFYPYQEHKYQSEREDTRVKKEALAEFTKNITKSINYLTTSNEYLCKSDNETSPEKRKYYSEKSSEFYSKLLNDSTPYETVSGILKIYFQSEYQTKLIVSFDKKMNDFLSIKNNYDLIPEDTRCIVNKSYIVKEDEIMEDYNNLVIELTRYLTKEK